MILRAIPNKGQQITPAQMQTTQQIIQQRVNALGVSSPSVSIRDGNEIVIELAGVHRPVKIAKVVSVTGRLEMFDFEPSLAPPTVRGNQQPAPLPSLYSVLTPVQKEANKGSPQAYYLFKTSTKQVLQGPAPTVKQLLLPYKGERQPAHTEVLKVPANREPVRCAVRTGCPGADAKGASKTGQYWYLFKLPTPLTGKDLLESGIIADVDPNTGQPIVTLQFTGHGSKLFQRMTRAEYNRGRVNAGQAGELNEYNPSIISRYAGHNAIVLDGELEETPYIDYTDSTLSHGIIGNAQITEPNASAARRTALVLQSGSLPYTFKKVELLNCSR